MSRLSKRQRSSLLFVTLIVYVVVVGLFIRERYVDVATQVTETDRVIVRSQPKPAEPEAEPVTDETPLPESHLLDVPFSSQAPFAVWDALHNEACEEASLMMVKFFRAKEIFTSPEVADQDITRMVAWETEHGYEVDVTVAEVSKIAAGFYGMTSGRIITNPTLTEIKREIASGRPVIVPAAGRLLPNPNFRPPGPKYHMLVIKGYTPTEFITNDPGTRRGEGFRYTHEALFNAMHDWNTVDITKGQKAVLVFD